MMTIFILTWSIRTAPWTTVSHPAHLYLLIWIYQMDQMHSVQIIAVDSYVEVVNLISVYLSVDQHA